MQVLQQRIEDWIIASTLAYETLIQAQSDYEHAQFTLADARRCAETQARTQETTKRLTEGAIALAVESAPDVITASYEALDARIALENARAAVEQLKSVARGLSWLVQLSSVATEGEQPAA